jgi:hypothetical protein
VRQSRFGHSEVATTHRGRDKPGRIRRHSDSTRLGLRRRRQKTSMWSMSMRGESIDGIDSTHTRPVSILRGESINGVESTLACPGTTLEHTAFFSVRTSIVIVSRRLVSTGGERPDERRIRRLLLCSLSLSLSPPGSLSLSLSLSLFPPVGTRLRCTLFLV